MAKCWRCYGRGHVPMYGTERTDERGAFMARPMPCPTCGGTGELSCCDGPAGHADELPTDPNERSGST